MDILINFVYLIASCLFVVGLKKLSHPSSARRGNILSAIGMLMAVVVTLLDQNIVSYTGIAIGGVIGILIGVAGARLVAMTAMPEMVAILNGFGGISSLLVGWGAFIALGQTSLIYSSTTFLSVLIGGLTFTGSLIAYGKLSERISSAPFLFKGQQVLNGLLLVFVAFSGVMFCLDPQANMMYLYVGIGLSAVLGVMSVIPIGGADMPVVISLLNSYSGLAACAAGFVIQNNLLIVAGALVGASGIILTNIMCRAMNRSIVNVLFSGFGSAVSGGSAVEGEAKPLTVEDAYYVLEAARSIVVVPGYGLAVAQAQHIVKELGELLESNGAEVKYAIHPVAGRMPGHMNVLLAEADVPYDQLFEMGDVNPIIESVDVAVVIGANDVVNPAAREDDKSPIYGMPIINVDKARSVIVLKRSMGVGFAGIQNPLFFKENVRMLFGDAKSSLQQLAAEFKD